MSLKEKINNNYQNSLKNKDRAEISTYRLILSAIKDVDIANRSGSNKKETFSSNKKTDYLEILAKVVSHKLNILLTTQRIAYE